MAAAAKSAKSSKSNKSNKSTKSNGSKEETKKEFVVSKYPLRMDSGSGFVKEKFQLLTLVFVDASSQFLPQENKTKRQGLDI